MVTTQIMTVTPAMAAHWLGLNKINRALNERRAQAIAEAITRGEWRMNGDAIRISDCNRLLDGQHRLRAIIMCNIPVEMLVVMGLPEEVFDTIDRDGKARSTADIFTIKGEIHATTLAAAAYLLFAYIHTKSPYGRYMLTPTTQQLEGVVEKNPPLRDAVNDVRSHYRKFIGGHIPISAAAFCLFLFRRDDPEAASEFFEKLETGAMLEEDSPILLLRRKLSDMKSGVTRVSNTVKLAYVFKAYRYFRDGHKTKILKIVVDGRGAESNFFDLKKKLQ